MTLASTESRFAVSLVRKRKHAKMHVTTLCVERKTMKRKRIRIREYSPIWWLIRILVAAAVIAGAFFVSAALADTDEVQEPIEEAEPIIYDIPLEADLQLYIAEQCEKYHIEPTVVLAMIARESSFNAGAIGDMGRSFGLMQIQPRWHKDRMISLGCNNLFDPYQNVTVGIDILAEKVNEGKGIEWALMAYNGGDKYADSYAEGGYISEYAAWIMQRADEFERGEI